MTETKYRSDGTCESESAVCRGIGVVDPQVQLCVRAACLKGRRDESVVNTPVSVRAKAAATPAHSGMDCLVALSGLVI